ncbi:helix-turn-helix domain-containing protein [Alistipes ihumii]|uniref:helix-turn-helix domain-containing protein n=1 Tax=Alistipes ihumii TaxID=1470347 RepID=UPI003A83C0D6
MNNDRVITADDGRIASLLHALKKGTKDAERLMKSFRPPFAGERYLTDKEMIALLKVSRRTLQEYRTGRKIPYIVFGGKVLYRESDIEKMLAENYRKAIL